VDREAEKDRRKRRLKATRRKEERWERELRTRFDKREYAARRYADRDED
jgi:hypothetical protein